MKTASRSRLRIILPLAVLGALVGALVIAMFLPVNGAGPDLAAAALGGLVLYSFGAMAWIGSRTSRLYADRSMRFSIADSVHVQPIRHVNERARTTHPERERLAA